MAAARWGLPSSVLAQLDVLAERLRTDPHAPTAVRDPAGVDHVHLADSLLALTLDDVRAASRVAEIGSGAGLPGLPLAAALPAARFDLIESAGRKAGWIDVTIAAMGLHNARAVHARAEEWAAGPEREAYDVVLARAVDALPVLAEYAAPLLRPSGVLVAWKRNLPDAEREQGLRAAAELGLELALTPDLTGPDGGERPPDTDTELVVLRRTGPLPPGYPRRPGRARKRPLG
jgi:16S rRNA (guanine527-N7)-methyltransferase